MTSKKKSDEPDRALGTGASGDIDHPETRNPNEGTPQDSTPVEDARDGEGD